MEELLRSLYQSILDGNAKSAASQVQEALDAGLDAQYILNEAMIKAMGEAGRLFEEGEFYVPEMLIAARAMQAGLTVLKPILVSGDFQPVAKVILGTVRGDQHDIGKNLVGMMLEGAAFEVIDLGTDVAPEKFVDAVRETGAALLGMSALLTTTMPSMKTTLEALQAAGLRSQVKVMVGGAPLNETYAREIGADGYAPDASRAVTLAKRLLTPA